MEVAGARLVEGVGEPSQFDGLSNGPKGCLDNASLYLVSLAVLAFLHPSSKNLKDYKSL